MNRIPGTPDFARRGGLPNRAELDRIDEVAQQVERAEGGGYLDVDRGGGALGMSSTIDPPPILAILTASDPTGYPNLYSWVEATIDGTGALVARVGGMVGAYDPSVGVGLPALEINDNAYVPVHPTDGTAVWVVQSPDGEAYLFTYPSGGPGTYTYTGAVVYATGSSVSLSADQTWTLATNVDWTLTGNSSSTWTITIPTVSINAPVVNVGNNAAWTWGSGTSATYASGSTATFASGSTVVFAGPTWNITDNTTATISSGKTFTLNGPGSLDRLITSADTATVREAFRLRHTTSGTAAAGLGVSQAFALENANGTEVTAAYYDVVWTDATNASEDADAVFRLARGGTPTEAARITSQGAIVLQEISTPSTPATGAVALYTKSDGRVYSKDDAGTEVSLGAPATPASGITGLTSVPTWRLANTITHADLTDADTSQDVTVCTLAAKTTLHGGQIRTKTVGSGGGVGALTLDILVDTTATGNAGNGMVANDLTGGFTGAPGTGTGLFARDWAATTAVVLRATADVNVADLTGGEWEVYLLLATLG